MKGMKCVCPIEANTFFMNTKRTLNSAYDDLKLSLISVSPDTTPEAVLQIAHGMCGCKERYVPFMEYMAGHGVACVACDHRGHGESVKSKEDLGYMYKGGYVALVEDMKLVTDWISSTFPGIPIFLLGHSMGSLAARVYAKKYDGALSGLILCGSPGYTRLARLALVMSAILEKFNDGRVRPVHLQEFASSRYNRRFASEGRLAWVCSDPEVRREMTDNPVNNYCFTANGMHNLFSMMLDTYSSRGWHVDNPNLPVTFLSGEWDPCMLGEKSLHDAALMMCDVGYHNVTSAIFTDMRHEILNEVDKQIVWDDILDFIRNISSK